jgi:hypothetical protein
MEVKSINILYMLNKLKDAMFYHLYVHTYTEVSVIEAGVSQADWEKYKLEK